MQLYVYFINVIYNVWTVIKLLCYTFTGRDLPNWTHTKLWKYGVKARSVLYQKKKNQVFYH